MQLDCTESETRISFHVDPRYDSEINKAFPNVWLLTPHPNNRFLSTGCDPSTSIHLHFRASFRADG